MAHHYIGTLPYVQNSAEQARTLSQIIHCDLTSISDLAAALALLVQVAAIHRQTGDTDLIIYARFDRRTERHIERSK